MGLFDRFRKVQAINGSWSDPAAYYGASRFSTEDYERILGLSPAEMWRTQPYLRTVVTFLARNIAQLGLQAFERVDETDRRRVRDGIATTLVRPNSETTAYELVYALVADLALYDVAYWLITEDDDNKVTRLPVGWVTPRGGDLYGPSSYDVRINDKGEAVNVPATEVLRFHGWSPSTLATGSSPVHALKEILAEQVQAAKYREQVWRRGGKVGAVLSRPSDAPEWSDDARKQFKRDWESQFTGAGSKVGGTPLLEDGMALSRVDFSAHEMEFIEGARLALNTVASVYHINPTMIGLLDNANYSNVREFRRMLYGDTLGPILAQIEDRLNTFLLPRLDARANLYVEFNIEEKLQGSFEEQTAAIQSSVGAPWLTRNEARALRNMPAIEGGDELVTPLNVLIGSPSAPAAASSDTETTTPTAAPPVPLINGFTPDEIVALIGAAATLIRSGFAPEPALLAVGLDPVEHLGLLPVTVQRPEAAVNPDTEIDQALKLAAAIRAKMAARARALTTGKRGNLFAVPEAEKATPSAAQIKRVGDVLLSFFDRQGASVLSGSKWDARRWNKELTDDLHAVSRDVTSVLGKAEARRLGYRSDDFNDELVVNYLAEVAARYASGINATTKSQLDTERKRGEDGDSANVFSHDRTKSRAAGVGVGVTTFLAGFAAHEAASQIAAAHELPEPTKTWSTGANPRSSHADMDGETVKLSEDFSNGMPWPGAGGEADEVANCNCELVINL